MILLAISVPVLAAATPARVRDETEAKGPWQYSLRSLLLATALCAVVFALAPFGYVVAMFAAGGWGLYVFARLFMQRRPVRGLHP